MINNRIRLISTFTLIILDILWIYFFMGNRYIILIKNIQNSSAEFKYEYAIIAYILMILGLNLFVLPLINIDNITLCDCFSKAFLFGVILYGVYNFTNASIFNNWDMNIAIYDMLWGGTVYFLSCYILKFIY